MDILSKKVVGLTQPVVEDDNWCFEDIFSLEELQKLQDAFADATGVASMITDTSGNPLTKPSNFCRLCTEIIRSTEKGIANCRKSDTIIGVSDFDGPTMKTCLSGKLWEGGTSIYIGNRHVANWLVGQVLVEEPDLESMKEYAREIGVDEEEFLAALKEVKRMPKAQFTKVCEAIFLIAKQISTLAMQNIKQSSYIKERQRAEEAISHLAYHDILTGLPNRMLFNDRLVSALNLAQHNGEMLAVLFLDLDRFKLINDTLGHAVGDKLLQEVAQRLTICLRKEHTVARLGGDEFTILLPQITGVEDVSNFAGTILKSLSEPFNLDGHEVYVTTSMGISLYPNDGVDVENLVKNADTAMYRAKDNGRNNFQFYTSSMNEKAFKRLALENRLFYALEHEEFVLHYQPQVDLKTEKIIGMEALIRWQHPELGMVFPNDFISLVEENGFIIPLGEWVLRRACRQNKAWQEAGFHPLRIAVNISMKQFQQPNFVRLVKGILEETELEPQWLELEITESLAMQDVALTIKTLAELKEMGIYFSIDDFGSGYSFLNCLKKVPVDALKIDPSFINNLQNNSHDAAIATAVISLAHNLNLQVTAEGVETKEQLAFLKERNCDKLQGYLFSRPISSEAFEQLLKRGG